MPHRVIGTTLLLLLAGVGGARAQLGVFGGVNFAQLDDIDVSDVSQSFENRTGFHIGVAVSTGAGPVSLRLGAMYLNAGPLFEGASFLSTDNFDVDYVSLPLDLRIRSGPVYVFGGPEASLLLSSDAPADFEDDLETWSVDAGFGAGLVLGPVYVEGRYALGLSSLTEDTFEVGGVTFFTSDRPKASALRVSAGLGF